MIICIFERSFRWMDNFIEIRSAFITCPVFLYFWCFFNIVGLSKLAPSQVPACQQCSIGKEKEIMGSWGNMGSRSIWWRMSLPWRYNRTCQSLFVLEVLLKSMPLKMKAPGLIGRGCEQPSRWFASLAKICWTSFILML